MTTKTRRAPRKRSSARYKKRIDTALAQLAHVELVKLSGDAEPAYLFKHALVQDTTQSTLLHGEYKRLNRLVGEAYERLYHDRCTDELAPVLAQHYAAAGDDVKTLVYSTRAGDQATQIYANAEAIAFYTQALSAGKRILSSGTQLAHLYSRRGRVYEVMGRDIEALASYEEMTNLALERGDRALNLQALLLRGKLHSTPSPVFNRTRALALADEANALALELGDRAAQAHSLWNRQIVFIYAGEIPDAIRYGERAMDLARETGARELLGYILGDLARAYLQAGQMEKLPGIQAEALAIWRELDNKPMAADILMQSAMLALLRGDYDETISRTNEGIEISKAIGSMLSLMSNQGTQLLPLLDRGEFGRALSMADDLVREAKEIRGGFTGPMQRAFAAWIYASVGAFDRAAVFVRELLPILDAPVLEFFRVWAWVLVARYYLTLGDVIAARAALNASKIQEHLDRVDPAGMLGMIALGECLLAEGAFEEARELMARRAAALRKLEFRQSLPEIFFLQAQALEALGESSRALVILDRALAEAEAMQVRRLLWQIYLAYSDMEVARGDCTKAAAYRTRARDVLEFIVAHTPEEYRASFLNLPRVREVLA